MSEHERIIANVNTSMAMEGMALNSAQKEKMMDCLSGKLSYSEAVKMTVEKYRQLEQKNG